MFQSLFQWNVVSYSFLTSLSFSTFRVSILVLVECGFLQVTTEFSCKATVVSILVLVECGFLLVINELEVKLLKGFQSLFQWNVVSYRSNRSNRSSRHSVSILVLVECGFLHDCSSHAIYSSTHVSILVLVECGFLHFIKAIL